jgi:hypothetical protein
MTEQQPYDVVKKYPGFEVRRYPTHLVAEVAVDSSFTDAGNRAFGVLVSFISGRNSASGKIAMTAPVVQEPTRIAMTAPVIQEPGESGRHLVSFVMPSEYSLDTLPAPTDSRIAIREVPAQEAAVVTFSGRWTEQLFQEHLADLRRVVGDAGLEVTGPPRFARFDPPWRPWFLRRNEVVLPIQSVA